MWENRSEFGVSPSKQTSSYLILPFLSTIMIQCLKLLLDEDLGQSSLEKTYEIIARLLIETLMRFPESALASQTKAKNT